MVKKNRVFGLIGKNIEYSFSKSFFSKKFKNENILYSKYNNYDINEDKEIKKLLKNNSFAGLNVTIPYKKSVMKFIDKIDAEAKIINAINTIVFDSNGKTIGYNTDCYGFEKSLFQFMKRMPEKALILGTGGASAAISFVLNKNNVKHAFVSRNPDINQIHYNELKKENIQNSKLIINTTPLGTFPNIKESPPIPYHFINQSHFLFDLVYNPNQTVFLKEGLLRGAKIQNGYKMLIFQAEKSWDLWNII
jgi:shikimate dehydrogenase